MKAFDRLWFWWGKRRGLLNTDNGFRALRFSDSSTRLLFRGVIPPGDSTIYINSQRSRYLAYNRLLTDAEVQLLDEEKEYV